MTFEDLGRVLVVIPTYNERDNLEIILGRVRTAVPEAHVLVVDDNSPDGTGKLADEAAAGDDHVHVMHRTEKDGLGRAYIAGFRRALAEGYDVVVEMDADGSHSPEQLPRLLDRLRTADLVLGARYVPGGSVVNWPLSRQVISRGGNLYVRVLLRVPLKDATGGYRAFRADVLRSFDLDDVSSQGYCFQVDLMWRAWKLGWRIAEVPITFVERERGVSKMSGGIFTEALVNVAKWGLTTRGGAVRKKALAERAARSSAEESG